MADLKARRSLGHWSVLVPVLALLGWAAGFVAERLTVRPEAPLDLTPPPQSQLQPIVLAPRARHLEGLVRGPENEPIAEALVALVTGDEPHWTYTDQAGAFRLDELARGPWTVHVVATRHAPVTMTFADDGTPAVVKLADAARTPPEMPPLPRVLLNGLARGAPGESFEGFEVVLTPVEAPTSFSAPLPRRARVGADGQFAFEDLILGEYAVALLPEWAQGGSWPDLARAADAPRRTYAHRGVEGQTLAIELQAGALSGRVASPDGDPLEGALVLVSPENDPERVWLPVAADAAGEFRVDTLPAGRYAVTVQAGGAVVREIATVVARETTRMALPAFEIAGPRKGHE